MNIPNENGEVLEKTLSGSNSDAVKTTSRGLHYFKLTLHFVTFNKEHFEWLTRLIRDIQVGRLPVQTPGLLCQV